MDWSLPPNFSTHGDVIDQLFWIILGLTGLAFVLVEGGIIWFLVRYRGTPSRRAHYTHGSNRLEVVWTVIPAVIIVVLGGYSAMVWDDIKNENKFPEDALEFTVIGKQFEWNVVYPGADEVLGTSDDFEVRNQFHFPAGENVIVNLRSEDVIHSFFIPELRVKQDAVPGMDNIRIWFDSREPGQFEIACAELCGLGHYRMEASVTAHARADFDAWQASQVAENGGE